LPRVSGYEVLEIIKTDPDLKDIPVVVLTGSELPSDVDRCYALGANAYCIKPGSPEKVQLFVHTLETFWFILGRLPGRV
jgi:CheY-like chemotaxis protein